jgi:hypothetical protein
VLDYSAPEELFRSNKQKNSWYSGAKNISGVTYLCTTVAVGACPAGRGAPWVALYRRRRQIEQLLFFFFVERQIEQLLSGAGNSLWAECVPCLGVVTV